MAFSAQALDLSFSSMIPQSLSPKARILPQQSAGHVTLKI
jgi:hypothetical protein